MNSTAGKLKKVLRLFFLAFLYLIFLSVQFFFTQSHGRLNLLAGVQYLTGQHGNSNGKPLAPPGSHKSPHNSSGFKLNKRFSPSFSALTHEELEHGKKSSGDLLLVTKPTDHYLISFILVRSLRGPPRQVV